MLNLQRLAGDKASSSVRHRHQNKRCTVVSKVFSNWPRGKEDADSEQSSPGPPDTPRKIMQESREMIREGREWLGTILSRFGPIKERAQTVTVLDFEKPLIELDKRIQEV
jgi:hypothetical protein